MSVGRPGWAGPWLPFDTAAIVRHRHPYPVARTGPAGVTPADACAGSRDYPSILNRTTYPCPDDFHRAAMAIHDVDPCTAAFRPNRQALVLRGAAGTWLHVPELRVRLTSGERAYVSLRPAADPERFGRLLPAIASACRRRGAEHIVLDESVAVGSAYGRNCFTIRMAGDLLDDDELVLAGAEVLRRVGLPATLGDISNAAAGGQRRRRRRRPGRLPDRRDAARHPDRPRHGCAPGDPLVSGASRPPASLRQASKVSAAHLSAEAWRRSTMLSAALLPDISSDLVRDPSRWGSSQSCTGEFMSLTTGRRLVFESAGERDLLVMLDVDYRTVELTCQPERFRVDNGCRHTTYVPDVAAASLYGERVYFQCRPVARIGTDPTLKGRIESIDEQSAARGAVHRFCPNEALRVGPRLRNSRWVHASATAIRPDEVREVAGIPAGCRPRCSLRDLREAGLDTRLRNCLMGMVGHREVGIALSAVIGDETRVVW